MVAYNPSLVEKGQLLFCGLCFTDVEQHNLHPIQS